MKCLVLILTVWHLTTVQTEPEQQFRCDTPDEWLFAGNGTGITNFYPGTKWPGGIVKYQLHSSLSANDRREVQKAFDDIQSKTCIRFQQRSQDESAYTSIEADNNVCGLGHYCRTGGAQFAKFGGGCRTWNTMVHELGHNLCLGHEQTRKDRDDFLHFNGCPAKDVPGKNMDFDLRGSLYDYRSCMHYGCGYCGGGWPRQAEAKSCGWDGLSVMDADKLNDLYDCGGRLSHRWRPIDGLTEEDRRNMVPFGRSETGEPYHICRASIFGSVVIGKYWQPSRICHLPYGGKEHLLRTNAQVFTLPTRTRSNNLNNVEGSYKLVNATELIQGGMTTGMTMASNRIPCGRTAEGATGYAAVATIEYEGRKDVGIGKVYEDNWNRAYISGWGREFVVSNYAVVVWG